MDECPHAATKSPIGEPRRKGAAEKKPGRSIAACSGAPTAQANADPGSEGISRHSRRSAQAEKLKPTGLPARLLKARGLARRARPDSKMRSPARLANRDPGHLPKRADAVGAVADTTSQKTGRRSLWRRYDGAAAGCQGHPTAACHNAAYQRVERHDRLRQSKILSGVPRACTASPGALPTFLND